MGKREVYYTFHDPNPPGVMADHLVKVFTEVNRPRAEEAIRRAMEAIPGSAPGGRDEPCALRGEVSAESGGHEKETRDVSREL